MGIPMIVTAGSGDRTGRFRRRGFDDSGIVTSNSGIVTSNSGIVTADSDDCDRTVLGTAAGGRQEGKVA